MNNSDIVIVAFTAKGAKLAQRIQDLFAGSAAYVREQDVQGDLLPRNMELGEWVEKQFQQKRMIVFIGALGIVVRAIAPYLQNKYTDPAVICIDEQGKYIIPTVSGHLGGANDFAQRLAIQLNAQAIITTATDGRNLLAVDEWARQKNYIIENPALIVDISSAILDNKDVGWLSDIIVLDRPSKMSDQSTGELGVYVGARVVEPFQKTLLVRPPILSIGIGCKRNTSIMDILQAIENCFAINHLSVQSVARLTSIDRKADEPAIIELAQQKKWPFVTHSKQELMQATTQGGFSKSDFVQDTVGVDCVCERAAALYGELIIKKTCYAGITLAVSSIGKEK